MQTTINIESYWDGAVPGKPFGYSDLGIAPSEYPAAAKKLERLLRKGRIKRIRNGLFYVPKQTPFGELGPDDDALLETALFRRGQRIAYVTGTYLYNKWGLTTQIPDKIRIASRERVISGSIGRLKLKPAKCYAEVTDENYPMLQLLDAIKDLPKIPDMDTDSGLKIIGDRLIELSGASIAMLKGLALSYPPRARAVTGAILENIGQDADDLRASLNPLSAFSLGQLDLSNKTRWNIK